IQQIIEQFTLNTEQAHAFRLVAEHSLNPTWEPLRMFLGGAGGTGKSWVIEAHTAWFNDQNQSCRFRLCAYTGVAARNINGMTLHSALYLGQLKKMTGANGSRSQKDLIDYWFGVDYLFIDEVSMIG
ncbi:hypothetical protein BS47DRAFT_1262559, partial [Hydnum rufescens UP504]